MPSSLSFVRRLFGAALFCSMLSIAAPASAGVIGSFDPAFGPSIPNLGFRGTITLDVTPGCYALGGGFHYTGGTCLVTAQSAQVNYYNATTSSANLATVNLGIATFPSSYVFGVYIDPLTGQVAGFDTNNSATFFVSVTDTNPLAPIAYSGSMFLYFTSGTAPPPISILAAGPSATTAGVGAAYLVNCGPTGGPCSRSTTNTSLPARLTFTTVPEPDGLALALLGVVALIAARRRGRGV